MNELQWDEVFDAANCRVVPPPVDHCGIRSTASPLNTDLVATPHGDTSAQIPMEVNVDALPTELKSIEFELVGDLWLRLPNGSHNIEVRVHSPGLSGWFAITGGRVRSLTAVDSFVGGVSVWTDNDMVFLAAATPTDRLHMECIENNGLLLGWVGSRQTKSLRDGRLAYEMSDLRRV